MMNIAGLDINIIKALDALIEERNVSRAAKRLGITQPAMSNSLSRLREIFDDPLFIRTREGMQPTLKAEKLAPQVRRTIQELNLLFGKEDDFNPYESTYTFKIAASDYASMVIAPVLAEHLESDHPNIKLDIRRIETHSMTSSLENMDIDFVLGTGFRHSIPEHLYTKTLFQDVFGCAVSKAFHANKRQMSLSYYLSHKHIAVSPVGLDAEVIDQTLFEMGKKREITLSMPHFSVAIQTLNRGTHILTLPKRVLEKMSRYVPIRVYDLPFHVDPIDISIIWHEKVKSSDPHKWLRNQIYDLF